MVKTLKFEADRRTIIPSVAFIDIATGKGIWELFAGDSREGVFNSEVETHILSQQQFSSFRGASEVSGALLSRNFDLNIETPLRVEGDTIISIPVAYSTTGGAATVQSFISAALLQVSEGVETTIFEKHSERREVPSSSQTVFRTQTFKEKINLTKFKKGDILRLRIEATEPGAADNLVIGHDPAGRTDSAVIDSAPELGGQTTDWLITTRLKLELPIIVDI